MARLRAFLGYGGAILTVVAMLVMPFVLFPVFERGVAATGVQVDPIYLGGPVARTLERGGYSIAVHEPVRSRAPLGGGAPFVQLDWVPAGALPAQVSDEVDLDGDGRPDVTVCFAVPADTNAALAVDAAPVGGRTRPLRGVCVESFSALIARVGDRIVVRVPLTGR